MNIQAVASNILPQWNLKINCSKTEHVRFYLADKGSEDHNNEPWRKSKLLGSYMCSKYDIRQRCIQGNIAFQSFKQVWLQGHRICLNRLIQIYEALVVSVILYNCSSWTAPNDVLEKLDTCHRKHLRQILNIKYPTKISNEKLYDICSTTPLTIRVKTSRWKLFGHILRSPENSPAALSLQFAVVGSSSLKGRRGRHQINLLSTLQNDIKRIPVDRNSHNTLRHYKLTLKCEQDITTLRELANNRRDWNNLLNYII